MLFDFLYGFIGIIILTVYCLPGAFMVPLIKEPDNEYDKEAIRVELKGLGKIGYVANSPYTVIGESKSVR